MTGNRWCILLSFYHQGLWFCQNNLYTLQSPCHTWKYWKRRESEAGHRKGSRGETTGIFSHTQSIKGLFQQNNQSCLLFEPQTNTDQHVFGEFHFISVKLKWSLFYNDKNSISVKGGWVCWGRTGLHKALTSTPVQQLWDASAAEWEQIPAAWLFQRLVEKLSTWVEAVIAAY